VLSLLAEQKRIVAKVEALLALCDALSDGFWPKNSPALSVHNEKRMI